MDISGGNYRSTRGTDTRLRMVATQGRMRRNRDVREELCVTEDHDDDDGTIEGENIILLVDA